MSKQKRETSAYSIIKQEFGFKGNKQSVFTQFCKHLEKIKSGEVSYS